MTPVFPHFKPVALGDRDQVHQRLQQFGPQTSELTFTNLYMWQPFAGTRWSVWRDWLLLVCHDHAGRSYGLPPVGPGDRVAAACTLLEWLRDAGGAEAAIERADAALADAARSQATLAVVETRDHFDYLYQRGALAALSGRAYHHKKNHVNRFWKTHVAAYAPLDAAHVSACLAAADQWCRAHHCCQDSGLTGEWQAIQRALRAWDALQLQGGVLLVEGQVCAFSFGEMLTADTAVVHVEKADAAIPELYAVINQQCCAEAWPSATYVNREQDLGDAGLRQAKESYHPVRLIPKYTIALT